MFRILRSFWRNENGQDLAEYCLLTAIVALIALGIMFSLSGGLEAVWGNANAIMASGAATSSTPTVNTGTAAQPAEKPSR